MLWSLKAPYFGCIARRNDLTSTCEGLGATSRPTWTHVVRTLKLLFPRHCVPAPRGHTSILPRLPVATSVYPLVASVNGGRQRDADIVLSPFGYMWLCRIDMVWLPESMSVYVHLRFHSTVVFFQRT
jgi:hypothetical protein